MLRLAEMSDHLLVGGFFLLMIFLLRLRLLRVCSLSWNFSLLRRSLTTLSSSRNSLSSLSLKPQLDNSRSLSRGAGGEIRGGQQPPGWMLAFPLQAGITAGLIRCSPSSSIIWSQSRMRFWAIRLKSSKELRDSEQEAASGSAWDCSAGEREGEGSGGRGCWQWLQEQLGWQGIYSMYSRLYPSFLRQERTGRQRTAALSLSFSFYFYFYLSPYFSLYLSLSLYLYLSLSFQRSLSFSRYLSLGLGLSLLCWCLALSQSLSPMESLSLLSGVWQVSSCLRWMLTSLSQYSRRSRGYSRLQSSYCLKMGLSPCLTTTSSTSGTELLRLGWLTQKACCTPTCCA